MGKKSTHASTRDVIVLLGVGCWCAALTENNNHVCLQRRWTFSHDHVAKLTERERTGLLLARCKVPPSIGQEREKASQSSSAASSSSSSLSVGWRFSVNQIRTLSRCSEEATKRALVPPSIHPSNHPSIHIYRTCIKEGRKPLDSPCFNHACRHNLGRMRRSFGAYTLCNTLTLVGFKCVRPQEWVSHGVRARYLLPCCWLMPGLTAERILHSATASTAQTHLGSCTSYRLRVHSPEMRNLSTTPLTWMQWGSFPGNRRVVTCWIWDGKSLWLMHIREEKERVSDKS